MSKDQAPGNAAVQMPRFRGPFAGSRRVRWARRQAELAHLRSLMAENQRRLDELKEARTCKLCEAKSGT